MANKNSVITMPQIERFKPATTARWLNEYLYTNQNQQAAVENYLAHIRLVQVLYGFLETTHEIDPLDYHQALFAIYKWRDWTINMMRYFLRLQEAFLPLEWAMVWKQFYRLSRERLMAQASPRKAEVLLALNQMAQEVLGDDFIKAEVIPMNAADGGSG